MSGELVSIIVPSYAHQAYIVDCLHSLHAQTHERIELILIDDCSPDRTFETARALLSTPFGRRFERVELYRKPENRGAHDSLNMGLDLARGDYIAIVNSDDLFVPARLERMLLAMRDTGSTFAFSLVDLLKDGDTATAEEEATLVPPALTLLGLRQELSLLRDPTVGFALLRENLAISTGNFLFSAALARKVGHFQPLKYCHDWDFILQALIHTEPVAVMEPLYLYRLHGQNSFRAYQNLAEIETEVVLRRFFRATVRGTTPNPLCPSPTNWPGYFETFVRGIEIWRHWAREAGLPVEGWRISEQKSATTTDWNERTCMLHSLLAAEGTVPQILDTEI